jgi:hypothetical protein
VVATPLSPTIRYFPPGTRKVYFCPSIGAPSAPTRAELDAGTDLSAEIDTMTGFSLAGATVDTPDMGSPFTSQVPGRQTAANNSIDFYISANSVDVRSLLTRGTAGFIVLLWEGDVSGLRMDVFPVTVITQAMDTTVDDPGKCTIDFAVTKLPSTGLVIP